ncbi:unnamed protein product [Linum tenue]|uniref:DUF4283 domain-containing protein n=1 Tax=Linum tenue TaxID=586396 RepID=A0AAV0RT10_9ROSI|nr:unnamed protein product [Linum tenue]
MGAARRLFGDTARLTEWYTADSDSEDTAAAIREDGRETGFDGEDDPTYPQIYFSPTEERTYSRELRSSLIVKALGRAVSYTAVSLRLNAIWAKAGGIQVTSMKNGYFLVRFTSGLDYERAVTNGPWMIGPNYLTVHMWERDFDPYNHEVSSTLVWGRLLDIPVHYFHREAVMKIFRRIGKPLRIDEATRTVARSDYARVCVQVDLTKPLLSKFSINGKKYFIQYEGLEKICLNCGTYAERGACTCTRQQEPMEADAVEKEMPRTDKQPEAVYGEWMIAKRKPRPHRPDQESGSTQQADKSRSTKQTKGGGSRFHALQVEDTDELTSEKEENANMDNPEPGTQTRETGAKETKKNHPNKKKGATPVSPTISTCPELNMAKKLPTANGKGIGHEARPVMEDVSTGKELGAPMPSKQKASTSSTGMKGHQSHHSYPPPEVAQTGRPPDTDQTEHVQAQMDTSEPTKTNSSGMIIDGADPSSR